MRDAPSDTNVLEPFPGRGPAPEQLVPDPAADADHDRAGKNVEYHLWLLMDRRRRLATPLLL